MDLIWVVNLRSVGNRKINPLTTRAHGAAGVRMHGIQQAQSGNHRRLRRLFTCNRRTIMARKYSKKASAKVERAMKERNAGTLKSGRSGRKVTSRKQAIAIGLSEARAAGAKVPKKTAKKRKAKKAKR